MKKLLLTLFLIGMVGVTQAQTLFTKNDLYQDPTSLLLIRKIIPRYSIFNNNLHEVIKDWSKNYTEKKIYITNNTDTQITLIYITPSFYSKRLGLSFIYDWYIKVDIKFQKEYIDISFYDYGNEYSTEYNEGSFGSKIKKREYNLISIQTLNIGDTNKGYISIKQDCISMLNSLEVLILSNNTINNTLSKDTINNTLSIIDILLLKHKSEESAIKSYLFGSIIGGTLAITNPIAGGIVVLGSGLTSAVIWVNGRINYKKQLESINNKN